VDSPQNKPAAALTRIGKYDIVGVLGRGGMGVVYRGIDRHLGREVAIKTLTEGIKSDADMLSRFYDEGRKTGSFKHPNIVTVFELGDDNGIPYIVMELVDGDPLDNLIGSDEQLPLVDRLRIVEEVCSALAYAHRHNVVHRDVKPANIFVQPDGRVKLLDFGIARLEERRSHDLSLTRPGHIIGTVPYMAPERLRDKPLDRRSDIFAAGVVLYQLVAGELPFSGDEVVLMQKILNEPHPPLSSKCKACPASLDLIIDRALAKSPDDRYSTADEMAADLTTAIAEIRQEQAQELLPEAKRWLEAQDLLRARAALQQLLKIESKHAEARELLAEIQRQLSQRQRAERIQQIWQQAEGLLENKEFDKSLAILEEGFEIDSTNPELMKLRQRVEKAKEKQERVREFMRQADAARRAGDYQLAISAARKALKVDKSNSKGMVLVNLLTKEAEEAEKRAEMKALLQSARGELSARHYKEALDILQKAEHVDPTNPELQLLLGDASSGLEQIRRKELIARLETEAYSAASLDRLQQVARAIQEAMASMPAESTLIQLNAQVDRQIREHENRKFVDETIQACRDLRHREALELVRKARKRIPGEDRLQELERLLTERVTRQTVEERREEYLSQAREALGGSKYVDAVQILESCEQEGIATDEIRSLLDFARHEHAEHRQLDLLLRQVAEAQSLIGDSAFEAAIAFLQEALQENDDSALRLLLEEASAGRESLGKQVEAALASAGRLVRAGKHSEAIQFLQAQPPAVLGSIRLQAALSALKEEQQQAVFRMIGRAYTGLDTDLPAGEKTMRRVAAALDNSTFAASVAEAFHTRIQVFADQMVAGHVGKYKMSLRNRDKAGAGDLVKQVSAIIDYAGPEAKLEWQSILAQTGKTGLLSRLRK
jgi:serine/threonine-protein kinase